MLKKISQDDLGSSGWERWQAVAIGQVNYFAALGCQRSDVARPTWMMSAGEWIDANPTHVMGVLAVALAVTRLILQRHWGGSFRVCLREPTTSQFDLKSKASFDFLD